MNTGYGDGVRSTPFQRIITRFLELIDRVTSLGKEHGKTSGALGIERALHPACCTICAGILRERFRHSAYRGGGHRTCQQHDRRAFEVRYVSPYHSHIWTILVAD